MKFILYSFIQLIAYGIDMGGFLLLTHFGFLGPLPANISSKIAAAGFAFTMHRNVTFYTEHKKDKKAQAVRYITLCLVNIPLSSTLLLILLHYIPIAFVAKFIADVACVFFNYTINRYFIFNPRRES